MSMGGSGAAAPLAGRVALVTGASRGIGRATAVALSRLGAHCVLTARSPGGLSETDDLIQADGGAGATLLPLDLVDAGAIDGIGPSLGERFGRLDILVHAAAVLGALTPVTHVTARDWGDVMAVNLTGTWRLIRTTAPLLEAARPGQAVFLTDPVATTPRAFWGLLAASKAGVEALVRTWQDESRHHVQLRIALVDPGATATRLRACAMPGEAAETLPDPQTVGDRVARSCLPDAFLANS